LEGLDVSDDENEGKTASVKKQASAADAKMSCMQKIKNKIKKTECYKNLFRP